MGTRFLHFFHLLSAEEEMLALTSIQWNRLELDRREIMEEEILG